ncbi:MAG: PepSY-like domain-containing protein [Bacteroidales bacterium]|nr:PepSY-like domain-containing protein [Bacteroidales bacterium]
MKTMALLFAAMLISFGLCACDNGDDHPTKISTDIIKAFEQRYPQAVQVDWDREGKYYVAEFKAPYGGATGIITPTLYEMEAWFDARANWKMTVMEITYDILPAEVKGGFTTSKYSEWRVEDTDIIERNGKETVYALEVKHGKDERCLYFNSRGELTKEMRKEINDYRDLL